MSDEMNQEQKQITTVEEEPQIKIASKEDVLSYAKEQSESEKLFFIPSPKGDSYFKAKVLTDFNKIAKIMTKAERNTKMRHPDFADLADEIIQSATWLMEVVVEPEFTYEEWISIVRNSGLWSQSVEALIRKNCGMSPQLLNNLQEEFQNLPFAK